MVTVCQSGGRRPLKVCVPTGARADYGLLYWLLRELGADSECELQLVVTGMHLSPEFGMTVNVIEADGFDTSERVEMLLSGDSPAAITKSIGLGVIGFADVLGRLSPDVIVLLGDRFEMLAAAQAAMVAGVPIAHLHGGESTEGLIDEAIRHAVTKMAHLHFVAAEPYRRRVIQMGESPERVFNVGAIGLDHLKRTTLLSTAELEAELDLGLSSPVFLVTHHPETLVPEDQTAGLRELLEALDGFPDAKVVITYPNADTHGRTLIPMIEEFAVARPGRVKAVRSLGQQRYLSLLRAADVVVGNSSSGIIEAPSVQTPTVNVGSRQAGRLRADSVLDVEPSSSAIMAAIREALSERMQTLASRVSNPYGEGAVAPQVVRHLKEIDLRAATHKRFWELDVRQ